MTDCPDNLKYSQSHEWVADQGDGVVTVGITAFAQEQLGDLVFVELPELEQTVAAGSELAVVESVKAASDIYSPVSGTVVEVNEDLSSEPEIIAQDPYGNGWIFKIKMDKPEELKALLSSKDYQQQISED